MAKAGTQRRATVTVAKPEDRPPDPTAETQATAAEGGEGPKAALAPAYRHYLEARRSLALAFKDREYRDQGAYRDAERRYRVYAEAIDNAIKAREKAELDAADEHKANVSRAIDRAQQLYRDKTKQATADCRQTVMDAWKESRESADRATAFCEEAIDKAMRAREKTELDALNAYRTEIDRAVDRSSQEYKDKLGRALADCRQRVSDAWRGSMEASAHMTGVFEEDRTTPSEERAAQSRPPGFWVRMQTALQRANQRVVSAVRKAMRRAGIGRRG